MIPDALVGTSRKNTDMRVPVTMNNCTSRHELLVTVKISQDYFQSAGTPGLYSILSKRTGEISKLVSDQVND